MERSNTVASTIGRENNSAHVKTATFGAGCFWGIEAAFRKVEGVTFTAVGFMGGHVDNPTYKQVCYQDTGHTEVVHLKYDPEIVSYDRLLDIFWKIHNPTQKNRQGPDVGYQYRSVIFYHDVEQKQAAENSLRQLDESGQFSQPIATAVERAQEFYKAEEYHQQYYEKTGRKGCPISF